jgi:hypothetical protein
MGGSLEQEEILYIKNQGVPYDNIDNFVESSNPSFNSGEPNILIF